MKKILSVTVVLCIATSVFAQEIILPKKIKQGVRPIPEMPGIMIDMDEVTVGDWMAFLYYKWENSDDPEFRSMVPDMEIIPVKVRKVMNMFLSQFEEMEIGDEWMASSNSYQMFPLPDTYKRIFNELRLPITGISLDQVQEYLLWREELINEDKRVLKSGLWATARLFSPEEWDEFASFSGPREPENETIFPDSLSSGGCFLMNIRFEEPCEGTLSAIEQYGEGMFGTASYFADENGIYDVFGNVAEMTSEKGTAKGGSYAHWMSEGFPGKVIRYSGPEPWLGFRVVFEFEKID